MGSSNRRGSWGSSPRWDSSGSLSSEHILKMFASKKNLDGIWLATCSVFVTSQWVQICSLDIWTKKSILRIKSFCHIHHTFCSAACRLWTAAATSDAANLAAGTFVAQTCFATSSSLPCGGCLWLLTNSCWPWPWSPARGSRPRWSVCTCRRARPLSWCLTCYDGTEHLGHQVDSIAGPVGKLSGWSPWRIDPWDGGLLDRISWCRNPFYFLPPRTKLAPLAPLAPLIPLATLLSPICSQTSPGAHSRARRGLTER